MSLLDNEHILSERSDSAVDAWAAEYANDFISNIRFVGTVDSLPRLVEGMMGEIYLLKCGSTMETYVVISDNLGRLSWQQLNSIEV